MALIKCPECGKEISDTAKSCPNCGFQIKSKSSKRSRRFILFVAFILAIAAGGFYVNYEMERSQRAREANEAFLNKCPYNTYSDLYHNLNKYSMSNEDYMNVNNIIRMDEIRNVPFEQSEIYVKWSQYKKYFNH